MNKTAPSASSPSPADPLEQSFQLALMAVVQAGVVMVRVTKKLAEAEEGAVDALAAAAVLAAQQMVAQPHSLEAANEAGRIADMSDLSRENAIKRLTTLMDAYERGARVVRRTIALARRLQDGRPFVRPATSPGPSPGPSSGPGPAPAAREDRVVSLRPNADAAPDTPPERTDRLDSDLRDELDAPERFDDEIGGLSAVQVLRLIAKDLGVKLPPAPGSEEARAAAEKEAVQAYAWNSPERMARVAEMDPTFQGRRNASEPAAGVAHDAALMRPTGPIPTIEGVGLPSPYTGPLP